MPTLASKFATAIQHPNQAWNFLKREAYLRTIRARSTPAHQVKALPGTIKATRFFSATNFANFPGIAAANDILKGKLTLYGHLTATTKQIPNWHQDIVSGFTWPHNTFSPDIPYTYPVGTDIKTPWEVSRFHHAVILAFAYRATGKEKYAEAVVAHINDWITHNPVYYGVNWKVAMEVAIRAANWLVAYDLIRDSQAVTPTFTARFRGSIAEHGNFIWHNLEVFGVKSNHYLADIIGLVWIGLLVPDLPGAKKWLSFGQRELEREIMHQFTHTGLGFESSLAYHRLSLELASYTALLCQKHNRPLSHTAQARLEAAFIASCRVLTPTGEIPQFGDNDSGRLFIIDHYANWSSLDHRYLASLGSLLFPHTPTITDAADPQYIWWHPARRTATGMSLPHSFDTQLGILHRDNWWVAMSTLPLGQDGNGGHKHDDTGSLVIYYHNTPLIIDPGTGCYTKDPALRRRYRARVRHNAPILRTAIAEEDTGDLFTATGFASATDTSFTTQHLSATLATPSTTFQRTVTCSPKELRIVDERRAPTTGATQITLVVPDTCPVTIAKHGIVLNKKITLRTNASVHTVPTTWSPAYAQEKPATAIILTTNQTQLIWRLCIE